MTGAEDGVGGTHEIGLFRFVDTATVPDKARLRRAIENAEHLEIRETSDDVEEDFGVFFCE